MKLNLSVENEFDANLAMAVLNDYLGRLRSKPGPSTALDTTAISGSTPAREILPPWMMVGGPQATAPVDSASVSAPAAAPTLTLDPTSASVGSAPAPAATTAAPVAAPPAPSGDAEPPAPYSKEQIKAAAGVNPELLALISKRGRKSAEQQQQIYDLTRATLDGSAFPPFVVTAPKAAPPVGAALAGMTAQELNAALKAPTSTDTAVTDTSTVTHASAQVEVRKISNPNVDLDFLNKPATASAPPAAAAPAAAPEPPAAQEAPVTADVTSLSDADLRAQITKLAEDNYGLPWFLSVVTKGGGNMNDLNRDFMLQVLSTPDSFQPE